MTAGTIIGVIGASALGMSVSILLTETMHDKDRRDYYILNGVFSIIPYIIFIPLLSFLAQAFTLNLLFLILSIIMVVFTIITLLAYKISKKTANYSKSL